MSTNRSSGTKIAATLGPATFADEPLARLLRAGADVVRLNFSHGTRAEHQQALTAVRAISERLDRPVAVMGDLCGPKIRLGQIEEGGAPLEAGDELHLVREPVIGNRERVSVNHPALFEDVDVGDRVLIDDGTIRLQVTARNADRLVCQCQLGGTLHDRKGVNLPDSNLSIPALTEKDLADATWAVEAGAEYLALSFVRRAADVEQLRYLVEELGGDVQIIAKIETRRALDHLEAILSASDGLIVARGDLGVEVDVAAVPRLQKEMLDLCRRQGKPAIVATQMLQSMIESPTPTRAEVSDVANAIFDGSDAVLLTAETAIGRFSDKAVQMLEHIAVETEKYDQERLSAPDLTAAGPEVAAAVARGLCNVASDSHARAVVLWSQTGTLARLVSKHRLDCPVIALTPSAAVQRRMNLYYGVTPLRVDNPGEAGALVRQAQRVLLEHRWACTGDQVVIGFGPRAFGGNTGAIVVHTIDSD